MKVDIITRHAIINYGSLLQALATQDVIESMGHEAEIIDYIRPDEHYSNREKYSIKRKPEWNNNPIKRMIYLALRQPQSRFAGKGFEKERNRLLRMTRRYSDKQDLINNKPKADVYMTGSDQVWGPVENGDYDDAYFLSFTDDSDKRISYASSFGRTEMTDEVFQFYKSNLSRYSHISVRENSAKSIVESMGFDVNQVLDPTLLLDRNHWKQYFEAAPKQKYILIYQINNDKKLGEYAERLSAKTGLPIIRIGAALHYAAMPGKLKLCFSMGEFLSYIDNAECLITDSFHGTAFAINFNTPFVEILPNNKTGTRNVSILELTGLTERILRDTNNLDLAMEKIDFDSVNQIIAEERKRSRDIFKKMIEE